MHRDEFLAKLARYVPLDNHDEQSRREIEWFVREHPTCFDSTFTVGHITGSAWLIDASAERVLLTLHRKLGRWLQLGGHADGNPDVLAVAIREAKEESGINEIEPVSEEIFDLGVHHTPGHDGMAEHVHFDVRFLLRANGDGRFIVSDESHALAWFSIQELESMELDSAVQRMSRKWAELRLRNNGIQ